MQLRAKGSHLSVDHREKTERRGNQVEQWSFLCKFSPRWRMFQRVGSKSPFALWSKTTETKTSCTFCPPLSMSEGLSWGGGCICHFKRNLLFPTVSAKHGDICPDVRERKDETNIKCAGDAHAEALNWTASGTEKAAEARTLISPEPGSREWFLLSTSTPLEAFEESLRRLLAYISRQKVACPPAPWRLPARALPREAVGSDLNPCEAEKVHTSPRLPGQSQRARAAPHPRGSALTLSLRLSFLSSLSSRHPFRSTAPGLGHHSASTTELQRFETTWRLGITLTPLTSTHNHLRMVAQCLCLVMYPSSRVRVRVAALGVEGRTPPTRLLGGLRLLQSAVGL